MRGVPTIGGGPPRYLGSMPDGLLVDGWKEGWPCIYT
jgi:hypothetical protein